MQGIARDAARLHITSWLGYEFLPGRHDVKIRLPLTRCQRLLKRVRLCVAGICVATSPNTGYGRTPYQHRLDGMANHLPCTSLPNAHIVSRGPSGPLGESCK